MKREEILTRIQKSTSGPTPIASIVTEVQKMLDEEWNAAIRAASESATTFYARKEDGIQIHEVRKESILKLLRNESV